MADGISGESGAREASHIGVASLSELLGQWLPLDGGDSDLGVGKRMRRIFNRANNTLLDVRKNDWQLGHMGTTAAVAIVDNMTLWFGWLGDSRVYLVRGGEAQQLTVDHGLAQAMANAGLIKPADVERHPYRNTLWKYLGCDNLGDGVDLDSIQLDDDDRIVLLTDGVSDRLNEHQIAGFVSEADDPEEACEALIEAALANDSTDDLSVVTVFINGDFSPVCID